MSRTLDLLLVALVAGLAWLMFFREDRAVSAAEAEAAVAQEAAAAAAPELVPAPPAETPRARVDGGDASPAAPTEDEASAPPTPIPTPGTGALRWRVDDAALALHPQLALIVQHAGEPRWQDLEWRLVETDEGAFVEAEGLAPGAPSIGVALRVPSVEVLRWWSGVPITAGEVGGLPGGEMRLAELVELVGFDVVDADGASVEKFQVRWPGPPWQHRWSQDPHILAQDDAGRVLLPRRAAVRVEVLASGARADVVEPTDGARVEVR